MMTKKEYIQPAICKYDLQSDDLMEVLPASNEEGADNGDGEDQFAPSYGGLDDDSGE